jgi:hypothetical protein
MLIYADSVRTDQPNIDGLVFTNVCRNGENEATIIAEYADKKSMDAAGPQVAKIRGGLAAYMTAPPDATVDEVIWNSHK